METGEQQGSKKARLEPPMVSIDEAKFRCPICTNFLKPPIFQCGAGHLACGACRYELVDWCNKQGCLQAGGYERNLPLEDVVRTTKISCPFISFGCFTSMALYEEMGEHEAKCPHRPFGCPEPGCAFRGSQVKVVEHLRGTHSLPSRSFDYGERFRLELPESTRRFLLLAKEDEQLFLVVTESLPVPVAGFRRVSLVCLRRNATAAATPCKMSAEGIAAPATGKVPNVSVEMEMPKVVAAETEHAQLLVNPTMLHGPSKELHLVVEINKVEG